MSMPSPQTVGSVGTGLDIGGVIGQTLGTYRKGQADQTAYEYQSKIADRNAGIRDFQARDAITRGQVTDANLGLRRLADRAGLSEGDREQAGRPARPCRVHAAVQSRAYTGHLATLRDGP